MSRKKSAKPVREKDWHNSHETAFSHDRVRHIRAERTFRPSAAALANWPVCDSPNAVVLSHSGQWAFVDHENAEILCELDERVGEGAGAALAPGDEVFVEQSEGVWMLRALRPRRSHLSRMSVAHAGAVQQTFAANIDLVAIMVAASRPAPKQGFIDRILITADAGKVTPILVINKMDLVKESPSIAALYRDMGLEVFEISCVRKSGIKALREALKNRLSVVVGQSGVGKSSLLNVIDPDLDLATQEVSDSNDKGRHTTSAGRMYHLSGNTRIIDTPGVRQLGLWGIEPAEVSLYFPELGERAQECRFRDCRHTIEPDCAVRNAVESGEIPERRYRSYLKIRESLENDQKN
jgi:ribosome biogenesis GTPase